MCLTNEKYTCQVQLNSNNAKNKIIQELALMKYVLGLRSQVSVYLKVDMINPLQLPITAKGVLGFLFVFVVSSAGLRESEKCQFNNGQMLSGVYWKCSLTLS